MWKFELTLSEFEFPQEIFKMFKMPEKDGTIYRLQSYAFHPRVIVPFVVLNKESFVICKRMWHSLAEPLPLQSTYKIWGDRPSPRGGGLRYTD